MLSQLLALEPGRALPLDGFAPLPKLPVPSDQSAPESGQLLSTTEECTSLWMSSC